MTCEKHMKLKFQCPYIKFYWNTTTPIRLLSVAVRPQELVAATQSICPAEPKISSGSLQKRVASLCCSSMVLKVWSLDKQHQHHLGMLEMHMFWTTPGLPSHRRGVFKSPLDDAVTGQAWESLSSLEHPGLVWTVSFVLAALIYYQKAERHVQECVLFIFGETFVFPYLLRA